MHINLQIWEEVCRLVCSLSRVYRIDLNKEPENLESGTRPFDHAHFSAWHEAITEHISSSEGHNESRCHSKCLSDEGLQLSNLWLCRQIIC